MVDDLVDAPSVGRCDARERVAAVDHLEQRRLLAVEVLARALEDPELHVIGPPGGFDLGDRRAQEGDLVGEVALGGDDHLVGTDRQCADERAFDDRERVGADDGAVLERARLALRRVHDDGRRFELRAVARDGVPLAPGGETGAAASTEPRARDLVDDALGTERSRSLEPTTAARRDVGGERVDRR